MRRRTLDVVFANGRRCSGKWVKLLVLDESAAWPLAAGVNAGRSDPSPPVGEPALRCNHTPSDQASTFMQADSAECPGAARERPPRDARGLGGGRTRLAILVRKSAGGAVVRNRIRRHIREIYRELPQEWRRSWNTVLLVRDQAACASFLELRRDLEVLFRKVGSDGRKMDNSGRH